jgi:hypothetical protein
MAVRKAYHELGLALNHRPSLVPSVIHFCPLCQALGMRQKIQPYDTLFILALIQNYYGTGDIESYIQVKNMGVWQVVTMVTLRYR